MRNRLASSFLAVMLTACGFGGGAASSANSPPMTYPPGTSADAGVGGVPGNIGVGGAQDFAAFRSALDQGRVPAPDTLDSAGFFAEHYNSLPAPTCGDLFCLHGLLSVSPNLVHGGTWTLLQLGMNSPLDPRTVARPPLDLVVVIDRSGSMADDDKMVYAIEGAQTLVDQLGESDTLTLIAFDSQVETLFGPARVSDRAALKSKLAGLFPGGSTNIYDALDAAYRAALANSDETRLRRVIFLTDGLPTVGDTSSADISAMSLGYNVKHVGLTTIGVGRDAGLPLLRGLAEQGGGNFYFLESAQAIAEVFKEELAVFVAPLAYDVELSFDVGAPYKVGELFGTSLWTPTATGARIRVPSVYLTSRTSDEPGQAGGRRGGGSALIAELAPIADALAGHTVASAHLRFRLPGSSVVHGQDIVMTYANHPGVCDAGGSYSSPEITKNEAILSFFVAFRDATELAVRSTSQASGLLGSFASRIHPRLDRTTDDDLADDLTLLDEYIDIVAPKTR